MSKSEVPIACNLNALLDEDHHRAVGDELLHQATAVRTLEDGYEMDFPVTTLELVTEFIDGERRCCPFFRFVIQVEPEAQTIQLRITGRDGVKAFLEQELLPLLPLSPTE